MNLRGCSIGRDLAQPSAGTNVRIAAVRSPIDEMPEREPDASPVPNRLYSSSLKVIAALGIVAMLWWAQALLIAIVLGVLISYALDPMQRRLVSWHIPRALAAC